MPPALDSPLRWTPAEDTILEEAIKLYGYDWSKIKFHCKDTLTKRLGGMTIRDRCHTIRKNRIKQGQSLEAFERPVPGRSINLKLNSADDLTDDISARLNLNTKLSRSHQYTNTYSDDDLTDVIDTRPNVRDFNSDINISINSSAINIRINSAAINIDHSTTGHSTISILSPAPNSPVLKLTSSYVRPNPLTHSQRQIVSNTQDYTLLEDMTVIACRGTDSSRSLKPSTIATYKAQLSILSRSNLLNSIHEPDTLISVLESKYSVNTIRTILGVIKALLRNITVDEYSNLISNSDSKYRSTSDSSYGPSSDSNSSPNRGPYRHSTITSDISSDLESLRSLYHAKFLEYQRSYESHLHSQTMTVREEQEWASVEELRSYMIRLKQDILTSHPQLNTNEAMYEWQMYVWLLLELDQAALRNEYSTLRISNYDPLNDNHISVDQEGHTSLVFNDHKNTGSMGSQSFYVKESVYDDLAILYNHRFAHRQEYLFLSKTLVPFHPKGFIAFVTSHSRRYLGKSIGSQMIRKIIASEYYRNDHTLDDKAEFARSMLHSTSMSEKYRRL
ncbi:hypothetical protein HDU86_001343 [Geranomyces michiganensis]|nr:hypothetical protein HDU86_001343 [Geranomyces michiganensis]